MANSNQGQDHKDKYFDTSRKILSQEMTICNMEALVSYLLKNYDQCHFFLIYQMLRSKDSVPTKRSHHKGHSCEISKF